MTKLDDLALNIELVLISIVEGVALSSLALSAAPLLRTPHSYVYVPYLLSGLVILLAFWAQAILHAVSFIRWPLRMEHMFLYFIAAFLQVVAYQNLTDSIAWFAWWSMFSVVAMAVYFVDLHIISDTMPTFDALPGGTEYVREVRRRHLYELKYLVPLSVLFNLGALALLIYIPASFDTPYGTVALGSLQLLISLGALVDFLKNFNARSAQLPAIFKS